MRVNFNEGQSGFHQSQVLLRYNNSFHEMVELLVEIQPKEEYFVDHWKPEEHEHAKAAFSLYTMLNYEVTSSYRIDRPLTKKYLEMVDEVVEALQSHVEDCRPYRAFVTQFYEKTQELARTERYGIDTGKYPYEGDFSPVIVSALRRHCDQFPEEHLKKLPREQ